MNTIGIDIGTTTISIVIIDAQDHSLKQRYTIPNGSFLPTPHSWEKIQDVNLILSRVNTVLEEITGAYTDIVSIGLTGQMHGIVYVDAAGNAVSPLYTWQDGRGGLPDFDGQSICSLLSSEYHIKTAPGYGLSTHLYNQKKGLVPSDAVVFCTIADYLGMSLTGRETPLLHISQAASIGLYDPAGHDFMRDKATSIGLDCTMFPPVTSEIDTLGFYHGIPVSVSLGDNQASFLGSVLDGQDTVLVNIGTGSQISVLSAESYNGRGIESRPLTADYFLLVGAALCGGAAYAALESFFHEYALAAGALDVPQYEIMSHFLEQQPPSMESWSVKTTFSGTRENPEETGSITGIRTSNFHPASMIRGVLNGIAQELHELYLVMQKETGISKHKLLASGNAVRKNPALRQILQDAFQMPLEIQQMEEEAACGAALSSLAAIRKQNKSTPSA